MQNVYSRDKSERVEVKGEITQAAALFTDTRSFSRAKALPD